MPFYQYKATDKSGRPAEGSIRAASADAAQAALVQAGYSVKSIHEAASAAPTPAVASRPKVPLSRVQPGPTAAPSPAAPSPPAQAPPAQAGPSKAPPSKAPPTKAPPVVASRAPVERPRPMTVNDPAPPVTGPATFKTKFGKDRDLFFLFSQMAQYFHTGISPQTAMVDLTQRTRPRYHESLAAAADAMSEGKRLSDVFEKYPYLYSPDIIGALRAGEVSGNMAEACGKIAEQKDLSARLARRLNGFFYTFVGLLVSFPLCYATVTGSLNSMKQQDQAGGSLPIFSTLGRAIAMDVVHTLPWTLPLTAGLVGFLFWWHSMPMRMARHRLALHFPILGPRIRAEAMSRFTWALGLVSRGGVSPQRNFQIAAETVPNLVIREQLMNTAATMHESERLSLALQRSGTMPAEYSHIVETGELTGDVPRALADVARATDGDFRGRDSTAAVGAGIILFLGLAVITVFMVAYLYKVFYGGIISWGTEGD